MQINANGVCPWCSGKRSCFIHEWSGVRFPVRSKEILKKNISCLPPSIITRSPMQYMHEITLIVTEWHIWSWCDVKHSFQFIFLILSVEGVDVNEYATSVRDTCWHSRCMHVTGLDVNQVEIMLLHRVVLLCTLLLSVVSTLLLAEVSELPYIVFSDANLSWFAIPSSSSSTKVEALT